MVGYVAQELTFYDDMTVAETVELSADLRGLAAERGAAMLDLVDLSDQADKRVSELSGGMKQRLGVALALMPDPPVLLLDEPTSSLDVAAREQMIHLIEELRTDDRILILTSHNLDEVGMLVDRVLALDEGRIIEECPPNELAERLGLNSWLHLITANGNAERAVGVLTDAGFTARRNHDGVLVRVSAQAKASALDRLRDQRIEIIDFEVWR
jgi:ABC-type multidrug transport system ATPase subunit